MLSGRLRNSYDLIIPPPPRTFQETQAVSMTMTTRSWES
jgi:hypothetical protein